MDKLNFNEEQLKKRIHDRILFKLNNSLPLQATSNQNDAALKPLIDNHNILEVEFFSHRKFAGKFIVSTKKLLRKLLRPIFMKQIQFNQKVIDQLYVVDRQLVDNDASSKELFKSISVEITNDIIDECKIALQEVVSSNVESIRNYYEDELQTRINEQIVEQISIRESQMNEKINAIKIQLSKDIKSNLFRDLAIFEGNHNNELNRYHLLLMALRENPENLDLEAEVLSAFESMNKSGLKTNESI
ncbi:hypothetical protein KB559_14100 [Paenibacillus sp. Marseille-P2973]|uniref:hypothetical protein n=1 Tax=Paenibacillus sp. Marseille-P2973 TaxID=1871032 RepID=UPI001B387DD0|nr:hypothetical protein [Paenibacillus sp. Marseille-P2973]MBQ4899960.1 hypothetical protein [Paenibacillus sp. Marseille-P2973]